MKLARLESTTQARTPAPAGQPALVDSRQLRRVEALERTAADRERSLQQEMAEIEARAIGNFDGGAQVVEGARQIAAQLVLLGSDANALLKLRELSQQVRRIDDAA